jgi:membrane associated rhomboid family serine protease
MGIASRDYYRESTQSSWTLSDAPAVKYIILATVAVFLAQIFSVRDVRLSTRDAVEKIRQRDPSFNPNLDELPDEPAVIVYKTSVVTDWLDLDPNKTVKKGQVWRLITHAFCHDRTNLFHILFNMLFLYWFGREVEALYGSREFLLFYLAAAVIAGLAYIALDFYLGVSVPALGASGAVMAVTMLFTLHYPRHVILLFFILPLQMRWVMALFLVWDLHPVLLMLSGENVHTGIAHAAHLGGLAFGYLYYRFQWRLDRLSVRVPTIVRRSTAPRPRLRIAPGTTPEPDAAGDRVDQILAKISRTGQESLTTEERTILQAESERIRRRNR